MHEAGVEPAHPEIVGLKSTALDHSAIRAKSLYFGFYFFFGKAQSFPFVYVFVSLSLFSDV